MAFSRIPVTASYMAGRRAGKKAGIIKKKSRVPAKKATTALIKRVLNRQLETKYVSLQQSPLLLTGHITPKDDFILCLPPVSLQTTSAASNVREGDQIEPIRAHIKGNIWLDNVDNPVGLIAFVKLFFVTAKAVKNGANASLAVGGLPAGLLEDGTANPVSWVSSSQALQKFFPVSKKNYTLLKTQTFKLVKNGGLPIGNQPTHSTNIGKDRVSFSYSWKPPTLKYANTGDNQPQNHAPVMFAVCYSPGYDWDTDASLINTVAMEYTTSMTFKDA